MSAKSASTDASWTSSISSVTTGAAEPFGWIPSSRSGMSAAVISWMLSGGTSSIGSSQVAPTESVWAAAGSLPLHFAAISRVTSSNSSLLDVSHASTASGLGSAAGRIDDRRERSLKSSSHPSSSQALEDHASSFPRRANMSPERFGPEARGTGLPAAGVAPGLVEGRARLNKPRLPLWSPASLMSPAYGTNTTCRGMCGFRMVRTSGSRELRSLAMMLPARLK